jgi:hypothetical protein
MVLVGYWPLNESSGSTAYDHSGNENHGSINDGGDSTVPGATGVLGQNAYSFDGSNDYVDIDGTISPSEQVTVSAWINLEKLTSDGAIYDHLSNDWFLWYDNTAANSGREKIFSFRWYDGSTNDRIEGTLSPNKNQWHHICAVHTGSKAYLFLDSIQDNSVTTSVSPNYSSSPDIGRDIGQDHSYDFTGKISEVRLYNHALTPAEVQYLYDVSKRGRQVSSGKQS